VSEYQYYEFRALDRRLTDSEIAQLGRLSSHAEIMPTGLIVVYDYGDFRADPCKIMDKYFDAFLYVSNWGTRRLIFRLPRRLVDLRSLKVLCHGEELTLKVRKHHVLIEFCSEDEEMGGWEEGEGWMDSLVGLRDELLAGDYRSLTLALLLGIQHGEYDDDHRLPPLSPGLSDLSDSLRSLAEFLRIDYALIDAAGRLGGGVPPSRPSQQDYAAWIAKVPEPDKNRLLLQLLGGDDLHVRAELVQRYQETCGATLKSLSPTSKRAGVTVAQLVQEAAAGRRAAHPE